jgi:hypothetical protein
VSLHTRGPWRITRRDRSPCSIEGPTGSGAALAKVYLTDPTTRRRTPEYDANARLIAQAPALYEALCTLVTMVRARRSVPPDAQPSSAAVAAAIESAVDLIAAIEATSGEDPVAEPRSETLDADRVGGVRHG